MFRGPTPFPVLVFEVANFVSYLFHHRKRKIEAPQPGYDPQAEKKKANVSAVRKIVEAHEDCTAEVLTFSVCGCKRVGNFRLLDPGDELSVRCHNDEFQVLAFGEYVANLLVPDSSRLPELLRKGIPFEAYLGGRDMAYTYNPDIDFATLIIFYKIPGVPPTKVKLN